MKMMMTHISLLRLITIGLILQMTAGREIGSRKPYKEIKYYVDEGDYGDVFASLYRPYKPYQPLELYMFLSKKSFALFIKLNNEKKLQEEKAKALRAVKPQKKKVKMLMAKELGRSASDASMSSIGTASTVSSVSTALSAPDTPYVSLVGHVHGKVDVDDAILSKQWMKLFPSTHRYAPFFDDFFKHYTAHFLYRHLRTPNVQFGGILLTNAKAKHVVHVSMGSMGSYSGPDWTADFDFDRLWGSSLSHRGFTRVAHENFEQILQIIGVEAIGTKYTHFTFTGHSLGASSALILAVEFQAKHGKQLKPNAVEAVTFGPLKSFTKRLVTKPDFIKMVKKMNIINVLDKKDGVRNLPVGYLNVGKTVIFDECQTKWTFSTKCHNVKVYERWVHEFVAKHKALGKQ